MLVLELLGSKYFKQLISGPEKEKTPHAGVDPHGGWVGCSPPYEPDLSIKLVLISLKSPLISSFSPKSSLFSPRFVSILDPPLPSWPTNLIYLQLHMLSKRVSTNIWAFSKASNGTLADYKIVDLIDTHTLLHFINAQHTCSHTLCVAAHVYAHPTSNDILLLFWRNKTYTIISFLFCYLKGRDIWIYRF